MNETPSSPERDAASSPQRYRGDSSLLQRGLIHLAGLEEPSSTSEVAVGNSEPPLLWSFAAYSGDLQDVVAERPSASSVISENIPDELKERRQWICWEWQHNAYSGQKWNESPISPITGGGDWHTPDKWGSFAAASAFADDHGLAGIAFVIAEDDPFVGVDLTDCLDSVTGALSPRAAKIVGDLRSYSEISPSGTGIRIVARGQLQLLDHYSLDHRRHELLHLWPRVFHRKGFFPLTGQRLLNASHKIQDREADLERLQVDHERVLSRAGRSIRPGDLIEKCRIIDQFVVVTTDVGIEVCLDAATGIRLQDTVIPPEPATPRGLIDTHPWSTASGIQIYQDDLWDRIYALDPVTTEELWVFQGNGELLTVSAIGDGKVYVDGSVGILALDEQSGEVLWHCAEPRAYLSRVVNGVAYVCVFQDDSRDAYSLYALDAKSGAKMWHLDGVRSGPATFATPLLLGIGDLSLSQNDPIDTETGEIRWEIEEELDRSTVTMAGNTIYIGCSDGSVLALESRTGHERWRLEIGDPVRFLQVADATVFVAGQHVLYALQHT